MGYFWEYDGIYLRCHWDFFKLDHDAVNYEYTIRIHHIVVILKGRKMGR